MQIGAQIVLHTAKAKKKTNKQSIANCVNAIRASKLIIPPLV